jgi:hypothetical protein
MSIHVSRIRYLSLGRRIYAVDLGASERLEGWQVKCFTERVDTSVLEKLITSLINERGRGVALEIAAAGDFAREVVTCIEEFEEAADGIQVFVYKVDSTLLLQSAFYHPNHNIKTDRAIIQKRHH